MPLSVRGGQEWRDVYSQLLLLFLRLTQLASHWSSWKRQKNPSRLGFRVDNNAQAVASIAVRSQLLRLVCELVYDEVRNGGIFRNIR